MDGEANILSFNKRFCVINREASLVKLAKKITILLYGINCPVQCLDPLILPDCGGILNVHIGSYNLLKRCNFNRRLLLLHNRFRNCFISRLAFKNFFVLNVITGVIHSLFTVNIFRKICGVKSSKWCISAIRLVIVLMIGDRIVQMLKHMPQFRSKINEETACVSGTFDVIKYTFDLCLIATQQFRSIIGIHSTGIYVCNVHDNRMPKFLRNCIKLI